MELKREGDRNDKGLQSVNYQPDLFHNDRDLYLAFKKIENITAAIFLVTSLVSDREVLKSSLREHALGCLSGIVSLVGKPNIDVTDLHLIAAKVIYINSLLDIAFWSGIVSQMNVAILQKEISRTYKSLNDLASRYKTNFFINASFFKSDEEIYDSIKDIVQDRTPSQPAAEHQQHKGQDKRQAIKDTVSHVRNVLNNVPLTAAAPDESRAKRRAAILDMLKQKGNLSVKDFLAVVPEYSEKTIQRELGALVDEGIVKKEGERRWSTYSLV